MGRDDRIYDEVAALWRQIYGEAPPRGADSAAMLDRIMAGLPEAAYQRLVSPHLRPSTITMPRSRRA